MKKSTMLVIAVATLAVAGNVLAAGDAAAGKSKAASCAACHGPGGNSVANPLWPNLAGQHAPYVVKQLKDFKSGARKDPIMAPMAMPLSDQDMEDIGAYYASEKPK
jgi:cytochrome c553